MSIEDLRMLKKKLQDKRTEEDFKKNNKLNDDKYFLFPLVYDSSENIKVTSVNKIKEAINTESSVAKIEEKLKLIIESLVENDLDFDRISLVADPDFYVSNRVLKDFKIKDSRFQNYQIDKYVDITRKVYSNLPGNILPGIMKLCFSVDGVTMGKNDITSFLPIENKLMKTIDVGTVYFNQFVQVLNSLGYEIKTNDGSTIETFIDFMSKVFYKNSIPLMHITVDFKKEYNKTR